MHLGRLAADLVRRRWAVLFAVWCLTLPQATLAADAPVPPPEPKPVPAMQLLPLPQRQVSFQYQGRELTRYWGEASQRRPFLYPIVGPSGRSLTRMGHPRDPEGHSHHNSVWISHHDVNGVNFWADGGKGQIAHQTIVDFYDSNERCSLTTTSAWKEGDKTLLNERRRVIAEPLKDGEWLLTVDLQLSPPEGTTTLGKTPFGMFAVRMAKTIGVKDGGGQIRNSAGGVNEAGVFRKPARWVDYSGPIADDVIEGISLLDHPGNPNHPSAFHVRDDGWMGASLTLDKPIELTSEKPLRLSYRLYVHREKAPPEVIDAQWQAFSKLKLDPIELKKGK